MSAVLNARYSGDGGKHVPVTTTTTATCIRSVRVYVNNICIQSTVHGVVLLGS